MKTKYKHMYMEMAEAAAKRSEAIRLKVGACVVTEAGMVATGHNGTYSGFHTNVCEYVTGYDPATDEPTLVTRPEVIHAELNALTKMGAEGVSTKGATVFVTHMPCHRCAMLMIGFKIGKVYYKNPFKCTLGVEELEKAGILIEKLEENSDV